jgi:hypothetical protein
MEYRLKWIGNRLLGQKYLKQIGSSGVEVEVGRKSGRHWNGYVII